MEENLVPVKTMKSGKLAIFSAKNITQGVRKQGQPCDYYGGEHPALGKRAVCTVTCHIGGF